LDPRVFTVEIRLERFVLENDVTVEVSWAREIYPAVPSPAVVEVIAFDPMMARFEVVEVSCETEI
jgi:hypothetical protein